MKNFKHKCKILTLMTVRKTFKIVGDEIEKHLNIDYDECSRECKVLNAADFGIKGFTFCDKTNVQYSYDQGTLLYEVILPDDADIQIIGDQYYVDKMIIGRKFHLNNLETYSIFGIEYPMYDIIAKYGYLEILEKIGSPVSLINQNHIKRFINITIKNDHFDCIHYICTKNPLEVIYDVLLCSILYNRFEYIQYVCESHGTLISKYQILQIIKDYPQQCLQYSEYLHELIRNNTVKYYKVVGNNKKTTNGIIIDYNHYSRENKVLNILDCKDHYNSGKDCTSCSLYFADENHIHDFYNFGNMIYEVFVPEDANVVYFHDKYKTDKIMLGKCFSLRDPNTYSLLGIKLPTIYDSISMKALDVLKLLVNIHDIPINTYYIGEAIDIDSLEILQYLMQIINPPLNAALLKNASRSPDCFRYLHNLYKEMGIQLKDDDLKYILRQISNTSNVVMVKYIIDNFHDRINDTITFSFKPYMENNIMKNIECFKYIYDNIPITQTQRDEILLYASGMGYIDVIKYMYDDKKINKKILKQAIKVAKGTICIKYLKEHYKKHYSDTCHIS